MVSRIVAAIPVPPFIRRFSGEITGFVLAGAGLALAASLITYHSGDPSFNHLSDVPVRNALGIFGASMADVLKQTIGCRS